MFEFPAYRITKTSAGEPFAYRPSCPACGEDIIKYDSDLRKPQRKEKEA